MTLMNQPTSIPTSTDAVDSGNFSDATESTTSNNSSTASDTSSGDGLSFEDAIAARLDEAFGNTSAKSSVGESSTNTETSTTGGDDFGGNGDTSDDSALPSDAPKPPADKLAAPVEPDSEEALQREIDKTTKGWEKKQREAFAEKTYKLREFKRQNAALQAKLTELEQKANSVDPAEMTKSVEQMKALQDRIAEYEERLARVDLTQTQAWREKVETPRENVRGFLEKLSKKYATSTGDLEAALADTSDDRGDKIAALAAEMNDYDRNMYFRAAAFYEQIEGDARQMRENAMATLTQLTEAEKQHKAAMDAARKSEWEAAVPQAWQRVSKMADYLAESDDTPDWNAAIAKAKSFANNVSFDSLGVTEQAEVLHRAAAFPLVNSMVKALEDEVATLRQSLSRYAKTVPSAGGPRTTNVSTSNAASSSRNDVGDDTSLEDAIERRFREAGLA